MTEHDFVLNSNHPYSGLGGHDLKVSAVEINPLDDVYRSWKAVAFHLRDLLRTFGRIRNEFNITVSDRTESRSTYTTISDEQI